MDTTIKRVYVPMTETAFYILLSLQEEMHGYHIVNKVSLLTNNEVIISAGTMYGTLSKMEKDNLIKQTKEEGKRKYYISTSLGKEILDIELQRIERLYCNSKGEIYNGCKERT
jgi:DNA-binding PadR family transcriptional regulator